jgi:beta-galactosidase
LNEGGDATNVAVRFIAIAPGGKQVAEATVKCSAFAAGDEQTTNCELTIKNPKLWHPDHPWLYTLKTDVLRGGKITDAVSTHFGIRTLAYDDKLGFVINGQPLTIRGANRHQDFPWLGSAVPDNAAYRDIQRLKDAGFNFLRLAHYPQSPAVMDACDKLGLMVSVCTPGWQHFSRSEMFTNLALRNIRDMVHWHRNHPSVIMWEVSLNETYGHDAFYAECARVAHEEYPGDQMFTSGDSYASKDARHFEVPYAGWGGFYHRGAAPGFEREKRSFAREYGDYEFGGEHSTTRVALGAGEDALLLQAWNFIWSHNRNAAMPWLIGDCIWEGVDNFRGCSAENPIARCGVLDYLRLPKFSYYFFQSQRAANKPSIFIANYWTPRPSPTKVVVFSNCEEVELFLNGKSLGRRQPDSGPDSDYGVWHPEADPVYMAKGKTVLDDEKRSAVDLKQPHAEEVRAMFDGGNCRHIDHPPFTFAPVDFAPGKLKAVGYVGGKPVAEAVRHTPGKPAKLKLEADLEGRSLAADGADAAFIRATVCDADGNPVPDATNTVAFTVSGAARFVSPSTVPAEAGVATMLLRATGQPGRINVTGKTAGLVGAKVQLRSEPMEQPVF